MQYMKHVRVREDYILVLDSDMLIRRPMLPADFNVSETQAASENMWCASGSQEGSRRRSSCRGGLSGQ